MQSQPPAITLELIEGPPVEGFRRRWRSEADRSLVIGRGQDCGVQLPDPSISRRHAEIAFYGVDWSLRDLGSRHGCLVGDRIVESGSDAVLQSGHTIQIGPWLFRCGMDIAGNRSGSTGSVTISDMQTGDRIRTLRPEEVGPLVRRRLDAVLMAGESFGSAVDEAEAARLAVARVAEGVGRARVALVQVVDGEPGQVLAAAGGGGRGFEMSGSLLREAAQGRTAVLESDTPTHGYGVSIAALGIRSACCAPVLVGSAVAAALYVDAREHDPRADDDTNAFVTAMAQIVGLAMSNLRRASLERHRATLEADLKAARLAQRIMMPPERGEVGGVSFAVLNRPGRYVAGDLVGMERRENGRVCFYLGDVTGKGVGAAMLMGIAQSYLNASLNSGSPIEEAVNGLNGLLAPRLDLGQFISMWLGEYDPERRILAAIDAGHGYALLRDGAGEISEGLGYGGMPIAIDAAQRLGRHEYAVSTGSTLLLFSDGLVEQTDAASKQYGMEKVRTALAETGDPSRLLERLETELRAFAGQDHYNDDLTIAAFRFD